MKDIPTLEEYSVYLSFYETEIPQTINRFGMVTTDNDDALIPIKVSKNQIALLPGPEFSPILYRGQNEFHSVCKPTLHRPMTKEAKLIAILKKIEFIETIKSNPLVNILNDIKITPFPNKEYSIKVDYEALAQHYEFKTNHLDLTRSKEVAMFFASTIYDPTMRSFLPFSEDREVVLYKYNMQLALTLNAVALNPIGFQPFPRPDLQKAFSIVFEENMNFNDSPIVQYEKIVISKKESRKYFEIFEGGSKLFPKDTIDDFAYEILDSKSIPIDVIELYSSRHQSSKKFILDSIKKESYSIRQDVTAFKAINYHDLLRINEDIIAKLNSRLHIRGIAL